jgi:hypothetical protein
MDAAAGVRWCPAGQEVPHELNDVLVEDMQRLRQYRLKGSGAAPLLDALARRYPCASAEGK